MTVVLTKVLSAGSVLDDAALSFQRACVRVQTTTSLSRVCVAVSNPLTTASVSSEATLAVAAKRRDATIRLSDSRISVAMTPTRTVSGVVAAPEGSA